MRLQNFIRKLIILCVFTVVLVSPYHATKAQGSLNIIRDVEIESTLKEWIAPLLKVANIKDDNLKIILVQSDAVNAFVAGGANIFVFTGLLDKSNTPGEVIGVLAHELGHIVGGHLIHNSQAMEHASYESMLGTVLGIGTAILTGNGKAASAISLGAQQLAVQKYLTHSRTNESSADQAALKFLEQSQQNPTGLLTFFEKLEDQELLPAHQQNEYMRTHPLTRNRIETIRSKVSVSAYKDTQWPSAWIEQHKRMKAKLLGFISPERVDWTYNDRDTSFAAQYARAIAAYRQSNITQAVKRVDNLLKQEPANPYLHELKGQMLVEFGQVKDALPSLKQTVNLAPQASYFRIALGHGRIENSQYLNDADKEQALLKAIDDLTFALTDEARNTRIHRLLATAYGQLGDEIKASYHLAEEAVLQKRFPYAHQLLMRVIDTAAPNSSEHIKATDLMDYITTIKKKK